LCRLGGSLAGGLGRRRSGVTAGGGPRLKHGDETEDVKEHAEKPQTRAPAGTDDTSEGKEHEAIPFKRGGLPQQTLNDPSLISAAAGA
jgi:hypothetical protein